MTTLDTSMNPLQIEDLKKSYGDDKHAVHAVKGVSFNVMPAEIFGLLGPNLS